MILGHLQSKSNSRRITFRGGKPRSIKSEKALAWWESALIQGRAWGIKTPYEGDVCLTCRVFYPSARNDLDVSLFCDFLQVGMPKNPGIGLIQNDRAIKKMVLCRETDKERPRIEFWLDEYHQISINLQKP
jgi:hypothetical protein